MKGCRKNSWGRTMYCSTGKRESEGSKNKDNKIVVIKLKVLSRKGKIREKLRIRIKMKNR
jgi:hypothetical protein